MTSATRRDLLRMADAASNAQERSAKQLIKLHTTYDPDYPDLALQVWILANSALELRELIIRFRQENM